MSSGRSRVRLAVRFSAILSIFSFAVVTVQSSFGDIARAQTGCSTGQVSETTVPGYTYTLNEFEPYNPTYGSDTQLHRYRRVLFTSNGSDAHCTWDAPAGMRYIHLLVVGGGGAGGTKMGGGGGGGGLAFQRFATLKSGSTYDITVGTGGQPASESCIEYQCNGGNGTASSLYLNSTRILSSSGGAGGGGDRSSGNSASCNGFDACGGGGGGAAPAPRSSQRTAGGSGGATQNFLLTFSGIGTSGQGGYNSGGAQVTAGGGGGNFGKGVVSMLTTRGSGGRPVPIGLNQNWQGNKTFSAGGGGSGASFSSYGTVSSFPSGDWQNNSYDGGNVSGGRSASSSGPAWDGVDLFGGGGGGGGAAPYDGWWDTNYISGGRGGSGQVAIFYLEIPTITSSSGAVITHPYGTTYSSSAFSASGGNINLQYMTVESTPVTYSWSITDTSGAVIPGVTISSDGVVTVSSSVTTLGNISAVVRATDGAGTMGTYPITISTVRANQSPVTFSTSAPIGHHIGGSDYNATVAGGSGTGAYTVTVDSSSSSVCSKSSSANGGAVQFIGIGDCVLKAQRLGDTNYFDSAIAQQTVTVTPRSLQSSLTFSSTAPVGHHPGGNPYYATVAGGSGTGAYTVTVDSSSSSVCSKSSSANGGAVSFLATGTCLLIGQRAGDYDYDDATPIQQSITVDPRSNQPVLSFSNSIPNSLNVGGTIDLVPAGGAGTSDYVVSIGQYSTSYCSLSGLTVTALANGFCLLQLDRAGDYNYNDATQFSTGFQVVSGRNITLASPTQRVYTYSGTDVVTSVSASVSAGLPFSVAFMTTNDSSNCSFYHPSRYDLAFTGTGICKVYVEENDNTYSYTRSPDYIFYVIAPGDTTAPTIVNVTAPNFDGQFDTGRVVDISVRFNERVVVTGTPRLQLETGTVKQWANYVSGSYSDTLVFRYIVRSGDYSSSLDYLSTTSLALNSGTIEDLSTNIAVLTLPTVGSSNSLSQGASISIGTTTTTTTTTTVPTTTTTTTTTVPTTTTTTTTTSTSTTTTTTIPIGTPDTPFVSVSRKTAQGFQFVVRNYDSSLTYTFSSPSGTSASWANQDLGIAQVTGLSQGQSVNVTVSASNGTNSSSATLSGASLNAGVQPTFGSVTSMYEGFRVPISNYDSSYIYVVTSGSAVIDNGELVVSSIIGGGMGSVTLQVHRDGYEPAQATVSGTALVALPTTTTTTMPTTTTTVAITTPKTVAPVAVVKVAPAIKKGKLLKLSTIASAFSVKVPRGAKLSATVSSASKKVCSRLGLSIKGLRKGTCILTLIVTPKKGKASKKTVRVSVS